MVGVLVITYKGVSVVYLMPTEFGRTKIKVSYILQNGDLANKRNYRPISNLSIFF